MRPRRLLGMVIGLAALLGACTSGANDTTTTTTAPTTTSTKPQVTTTTANITTTTTPVTTSAESPWTIDYPLDAETVDDIPAVLTDRIGAPESDPDLSSKAPMTFNDG